MKLLTDTAWFIALKTWRAQRHCDEDPAAMGTAYGLDSITVVDFEPSSPSGEAGAAGPRDWNRRLARRSRL